MGAPIYQNAAGMGGAMGQVNADIKKKKQKTSSKTIEELNKEKDKKAAATKAEKERLNTKTKDTEARTVKQGRLSRKEAVKKAKNAAKSKKKESIKSLDNKKDALNIDAIESSGQKTGYNDTSNRKEARATKRQEMQDIRNEERGARRADRKARGIKKMGDRNNMSVGEATKAYESRMGSLEGFKKGERGPNPANEKKAADNKKTLEEQQLASERQKAENQKGLGLTGTNKETTENKQEIVSGITPNKMLDGPTQQEASEDSQGISSFMMNSKNRRGR